ncbi:MAG: HAD-IIIA family hydrolase [Verrucomicrobia bacterium]|nr:MAG: HAD-IIIA family hydrolase [Verrucomicrobiota bacterium]
MAAGPEKARRALFLDRDGTLIVHRPYLHRPAEVELLPGVREALSRAREANMRLFLFTNQSGVGRGWFTLRDVEAVNERMVELLGLGPDLFADVCIAPEAPGQPVLYRKPSPRFIRECLERWSLDPSACWMIGDAPSDWLAGLTAGIRAAAVVSDLTTEKTEAIRRKQGVPRFENLPAAIDRILDGSL